ncbi:MAG: hypothetical protein IPF57_07595 [Gammaproteobacteria bacterium]|nr:hypothetical protein [Gammaproteobacteria bacterium]MBK8990464.1 hypothetical protein [Gammaproteobacteria bacterium]MBK9470543.1 hypothetical protein [Gammaproteobacteria bacterium]MBP6480211.1 hypothetical protein [Pseudomonadales bacterium]MBP7908678.1 hypothetical protein [Pseudomonadales bacterium]
MIASAAGKLPSGGHAPHARGDAPQDTPKLTLSGTDGAVTNGSAIIVAPGGGYQALATGHEGRQVADWFAAKVPAGLHVFGHGRHGLELAMRDRTLGAWPGLLDAWLAQRGLPGVSAQR